MKLLLTSAGFTNKTITDAFLQLLGKPFRQTKLVFVPTAANVEVGGKEWLITDLANCLKLGLAKIEIAEIAGTPRRVWQPWLEEADAIMFGGGNTFYLMRMLRKSGLDKRLPELLKSKVYVGISAGSMVASRKLPLTSEALMYYEKTGIIKNADGLGFVDFCIRPHLNSEWFPKVRVKYLEKIAREIPESVYALDDDSAVVVDGGKETVVSEGAWKRFG